MKLEKRVLIPLVLIIVFVAGIIVLNLKWAGLSPSNNQLDFYINNKLVMSAEPGTCLFTAGFTSASFDVCELQKEDYGSLISYLENGETAKEIIAFLEAPEISNLCLNSINSAQLSPSLSIAAGYSCGTRSDPLCRGTCPPGEICSSAQVEVSTCSCPYNRQDAYDLAVKKWKNVDGRRLREYVSPCGADDCGLVSEECLRVEYSCKPRIMVYCQEGIGTLPGCACVPNVPHT